MDHIGPEDIFTKQSSLKLPGFQEVSRCSNRQFRQAKL